MASEPQTIPSVRICRLRNGRIYASHIPLRYGQPSPLTEAIERVQAGKTAFVARADAHQVLDALGVTDDSFRA